MLGDVGSDELLVVVVLKEEIVSELDKGDGMGFMGKGEAAYGYHVGSAESGFGGGRVVSFAVGRIRRRGRLGSLREMTMLAVMSEVRRMKVKNGVGRRNIEGFS